MLEISNILMVKIFKLLQLHKTLKMIETMIIKEKKEQRPPEGRRDISFFIMAYFINIGIRRSRGLAAITAGLHKLILAVTEVFIPGWLLLVVSTNY